MKTAFFYDTLCGMVYRCMFAGLDECGHAQWVSITPGEESKTLQDVVIDEELQGYRFILICMDDELAQLLFLELTAEIPVLIKDLKITDDLKKHVKKGDLGMFSSVLKERDYSIDNDKEEN